MASPQLEEDDQEGLPNCVAGLGAPLHRDRVSYGMIYHVLLDFRSFWGGGTRRRLGAVGRAGRGGGQGVAGQRGRLG